MAYLSELVRRAFDSLITAKTIVATYIKDNPATTSARINISETGFLRRLPCLQYSDDSSQQATVVMIISSVT